MNKDHGTLGILYWSKTIIQNYLFSSVILITMIQFWIFKMRKFVKLYSNREEGVRCFRL